MPTLRGQFFAIAELLLRRHRQLLSESESEEFVWVLLLAAWKWTALLLLVDLKAIARWTAIDK